MFCLSPSPRVSLAVAVAAVGLLARPGPAASGQIASAPAAGPASRPVPAAPVAGAATRPAPAGRMAALPDPLPTTEDLKRMFDAGGYADLLKQLPRVLTLRGKAAQGYDRYDLLMLKVEAHMRLKTPAPAIATLRDAAEATDDEPKVAYAKAFELLLKRSRNMEYQPGATKKAKPPAIDIVEPEARKAALSALAADELAVAQPKVERALEGDSLAGVAEALASLQGLDVLEKGAAAAAAAGGAGGPAGGDTQRIIADLRARGAGLMARRVQALQARHDEINKAANQQVRYSIRTPIGNTGQFQETYGTRSVGLSAKDRKDLKEIVNQCEQVVPNTRGLATATGGKADELQELVTAAEDLKAKASRTLTASYP